MTARFARPVTLRKRPQPFVERLVDRVGRAPERGGASPGMRMSVHRVNFLGIRSVRRYGRST